MRLRFLADVDLNRTIVDGLRRRDPRLDFLTAQAVALNGKDDAQVLAVAARDGRVLVTHDFATMPGHFRTFTARHQSPGVFLVAQSLPIGAAVEELLLIWEASEPADWANQLTYLPL